VRGKSDGQWSVCIYVRLPRSEIGYFKFILESYENLCYMTVIDRFEAIVKIAFVEEAREEVNSFLKGLGEEIGLRVIYTSKNMQERDYVSEQD